MLTMKELQYVEGYANRVPSPGIDYSLDIINKMEECYNQYNQNYRGKEFNILYSDSEEINMSILEKNLCHMLGIDFSNISGEYFNDYRKAVFNINSNDFDSYGLLELIFENKEKVAEFDNNPDNNAKAINYYKSSIKCEIFNKLSDFSNFNFICVDGTFIKDGRVIPCKNLVIASNEALTPYFITGTVISSDYRDGGKYVVTTLLAPTDPIDYFNDKHACIPTQIITSDNNNLFKKQATPNEKIQLLTMYANIVNSYNLTNKMDVYGDYENILNEMSKQKVKTYNN